MKWGHKNTHTHTQKYILKYYYKNKSTHIDHLSDVCDFYLSCFLVIVEFKVWLGETKNSHKCLEITNTKSVIFIPKNPEFLEGLSNLGEFLERLCHFGAAARNISSFCHARSWTSADIMYALSLSTAYCSVNIL